METALAMIGSGRLGNGPHFNVDKQRALIARHGMWCAVLPTMQCPCIGEEGHFNPNDPHCRGTGRWPQENLRYEVTLGMIAETSKRSYLEPGTWTPGGILCLTPPEVRIAERDLIRALDIKDTFNDEVLTRGPEGVVNTDPGDPIGTPYITRSGVGVDYTTAGFPSGAPLRTTTGVDVVYSVSGDGFSEPAHTVLPSGPVSNGMIDRVRFITGVSIQQVADFTRVYEAGLDYVLTPPNVITWLPDGFSPSTGQKYSIRYEAYPEYLVFMDSPRLRVEGHVQQSSEVRLMRLDKLVRT